MVETHGVETEPTWSERSGDPRNEVEGAIPILRQSELANMAVIRDCFVTAAC